MIRRPDPQSFLFLTFILSTRKKNGGDCKALQRTWDAPHRVGLIIRRRQISYLIINWHRFGLWKVPTEDTADTVYNAIKAGYRLFDGAFGMFKPVILQMGLSIYILYLNVDKITETRKRLARESNELSMKGSSSVPIYSSPPSCGILSTRRIVLSP